MWSNRPRRWLSSRWRLTIELWPAVLFRYRICFEEPLHLYTRLRAEAVQTGATRWGRTRSLKAMARRWSLNLVVLRVAAPRVPPVGVFVSGLQADQPPVGGACVDVALGQCRLKRDGCLHRIGKAH